MTRILSIIFVITFCYSCNFSSDKQTEKPIEVSKINRSKNNGSELIKDIVKSKISIPNSDSLPIELSKLCNDLYEKVINGYSTPNIKFTNNGISVLDLDSHFEKLKTFKLFTTKFIENERTKFSICSKTLSNLKLKKEDIFEEGIEHMDIDGCEFLNYKYYFQSQEKPDIFTIKNLITKDTTASAEIHFYSKESNEYKNWDDLIYLIINFSKNKNWKIEEIIKKT